MVHRVQEWEVANQSVFRAGEQIEFVDGQGSVLQGTISGVTREDGRAGSAQVRLDSWQQDSRAYRPGCDAAHVHEGHGMASADQRLGRPAGFRVPVEVRVPPVHRFEERVQSEWTVREAPFQERGSLDPILNITQTIPASQSAISGPDTEEEELDFEDDLPVLGVQGLAAQKATTSGRVVQGDHLSCRRELAGNLRRGEVSRETRFGASGGDLIMVGPNSKNVDVAIQVEAGDGTKESKSEGSMSSTQVVTGKSVEDQVSTGQSGSVGQGGSKDMCTFDETDQIDLKFPHILLLCDVSMEGDLF
ncbi:hypothetical protein NDU88_006381 [Pleurodeles waltl]|uniref:Uncharacterized protein n=1 Tax=Pleurodeles waltl TaxID=8319 RepID=A0AAV7WXF5_PLEWA|nr:hypothetical protein NDU88_006381 [Pleurodeles waltl]